METPREPVRSAIEVRRETLERGLNFLKAVEADYRAGIRTEQELIFFANKMQGLLFNRLQATSETQSGVSYDEYAELSTQEGEDGTKTYYTKLLQNTETAPKEPNTPEQSQLTLETVLVELRSNLLHLLGTYRLRFDASQTRITEAQAVLANPDALPSDFLTATESLLDHVFTNS